MSSPQNVLGCTIMKKVEEHCVTILHFQIYSSKPTVVSEILPFQNLVINYYNASLLQCIETCNNSLRKKQNIKK